jgi:hypothetical protein
MQIVKEKEWKLAGIERGFFRFNDVRSSRKDCGILLTKEAKYVLREWEIVLVLNVVSEGDESEIEVSVSSATLARCGCTIPRKVLNGQIRQKLLMMSRVKSLDFELEVARLLLGDTTRKSHSRKGFGRNSSEVAIAVK